MSYVCDNCGKKTVAGHSQTHRRGVAGKRWKHRVQATPRLFKPNLQWKSLMINGEKQRMRLCAKCIKRFRRDHPSYFQFAKLTLG